MARSRKRRIARALGFGLAGLVLCLIALPLWFPWVARPICSRLGISYAKYERVGYARFELKNATYATRGVRIEAATVAGPVATTWLWRRWFGGGEADAYLRAANWKVQITGTKEGKPGGPASVYTNFHRVGATLSAVRNWLPTTMLTNGAVEVGGQSFRFPAAVWEKGSLSAQLHLPKYWQ